MLLFLPCVDCADGLAVSGGEGSDGTAGAARSLVNGTPLYVYSVSTYSRFCRYEKEKKWH